MKHSWIIITLCSLLIIAGAYLMLRPRTVPIDQCSDVYRQYQGQEGLEVSFVKQYQVNDTTAVDVTFIHATTDSAWVSLCEEFIPAKVPDFVKQDAINHKNMVHYSFVSKDDYHIRVTKTCSNGYDLFVMNTRKSSICFFHIESAEQVEPIMDLETNRLIQTQ